MSILCRSKFNGSIVKIVSQIGDFQPWTLDWTAPMKGTICKPYTVQEAWNNMTVIPEIQVTVILCVNLTRKMIRCLCLLLCLIDDLSQSRHTQNLSHSFALNSIWPHTQDSKDNRSWGMNTLLNIQKQGERNSQEIDHLQISDDKASKSPRSFPWVPKLWRWVSCHQSPPTTSSYLSTTHPAPSIQLLNIINHVKQTSNGHWHQQKNNQISFQDK